MAISMLLDALGDTKELEHLHTKIVTSSHSHELTAFLDALECISYVLSLTNGDLKLPQKQALPASFASLRILRSKGKVRLQQSEATADSAD